VINTAPEESNFSLFSVFQIEPMKTCAASGLQKNASRLSVHFNLPNFQIKSWHRLRKLVG
jgi:hypothetical protein